MRRLGVILALVCLSAPAWAERHPGCSLEEAQSIDAAIANAKDLTLRAAVAIDDTSDYQRWFGTYSPARSEEVRATLKAVVTAFRSGAVSARCVGPTVGPCADGGFAYVFPQDHYTMYLCPAFFGLPTLAQLAPGTRRSEHGTREGTMVHEVSHFVVVADTEDHCYSRGDCSRMARRSPDLAVENADSYQYFTEDVTYYARQPIAGKPAPQP